MLLVVKFYDCEDNKCCNQYKKIYKKLTTKKKSFFNKFLKEEVYVISSTLRGYNDYTFKEDDRARGTRVYFYIIYAQKTYNMSFSHSG